MRDSTSFQRVGRSIFLCDADILDDTTSVPEQDRRPTLVGRSVGWSISKLWRPSSPTSIIPTFVVINLCRILNTWLRLVRSHLVRCPPQGLQVSASVTRYTPSAVESREACAALCYPGLTKPSSDVVPHVAIRCLVLPSVGIRDGRAITFYTMRRKWVFRIRDIKISSWQMAEGHVLVSRCLGDCYRRE